MVHADGLTRFPNSLGDLFGDRHRPMTSARTPDRDRQVALSFGVVLGKDRIDQRRQSVEEFGSFGAAKDVLAHWLIQADQRPEIFFPMGIGQEPNIHHDVGVHGKTVFVAERLDRDLQSFVDLVVERSKNFRLQLMHVEIRRIDDEIAIALHRLEKVALHLDRFEKPRGFGRKWVTPTRGFVAPDQLGVGGIEIQHAHPMPCRSHVRDFGHELQMLTSGNESQPLNSRSGSTCQLDDRVDERCRQIVHDVPAEILENGSSSGTTRTGQAGDDQDVCHGLRLLSGSRHSSARSRGLRDRDCRGCGSRDSGPLDCTQIQQTRNRRGSFVLGRSSEKARGRRGFEHSFEKQTVVDQGVDIAAEGTVDEGDEDILFHLFDREIFHQIRADPPILLGRIENLVVDPSAARSLQQRVIEEEAEPPTGFEDACHLGDRIIHILDVFEDQTCHDCIERLVAERHLVCSGTRNVHSATSFGGDHDLIPRRIDSHDQVRTKTRRQTGNLPVAAADIEYAVCSFEFCSCQRQNLLDVFGICSFSETFDPPGCMVFPEIILQHVLGWAFGHDSRLRATTVRLVNTRLSFSLWPSPEREWEEVKSLAEYADSDDWHCMWYADHFMPNTGDESIVDGNISECWSIIAAITAVTQRLRIGSLVSPTTVRHPAVLAKTAATIDNLGNGRLILGIGAGWQINEHLAYGIDLLGNRDRVDRFEEAIQIMRSLLRTERTTFSGRHFAITDAPCQPRPVQQPLPILVGTGGPRMSRITATHADEWNTWGNVDEATDRLTTIRAACEKVGRDPATLRKSVQALFFHVDDASVAARIAEKAPSDRSIIGDAHRIAESFMLYRDAGFDEVIIPDFTLGPTPSARREAYERMMAEVIPLVS